MAAVVAERGVVQVMRDVLADASVVGRAQLVGHRLEMSRRLRSDPALRGEWVQLTRELTGAIRAGCSRPLLGRQHRAAARRRLPELVAGLALVDGGWLHESDRWGDLDAVWATKARRT